MTAASPRRTLLDRSIVTVLPHPDETASRKRQLSCDTERLQRLHGTSLIYEACQLLKTQVSASAYATACTLFHRFYHQVSLTDCCVWSVSMACILLAAKVEDVTPLVTIRQVLRVYGHLYRKRRLLLADSTEECQRMLQQYDGVVAASPRATSMSLEEKKELLRSSVAVPQSSTLSQLGPVWKEWHDTLMQTENKLLRQLGFCLYWIPDRHAHKWLAHVCRQVVPDDSSPRFVSLLQQAWNYCNDSYRLDLSCRYEPEVISCAAVYLALLDEVNKETDSKASVVDSNRQWWLAVCGEGHEMELSTAANAILGICQSETSEVASTAFVVSTMPGGSFNDPGSYLWESLDGNVSAS